MSHSHSHDHAHDHAPATFGRAFAIGIALNLGFVIAEAIYGLKANSLALLADAGHNLSDVLGLVLAWGAMILTKRMPTARYTYGLRRTSILAALVNALLLLLAVGAIAWEAIRHLQRPEAVMPGTIIGVALVGIGINTATALLFMRGRHSDLNIRGAYLHMAADAAVSAGVVIAGLIIQWTGWTWVDPAVSLAVALIIVVGTWGVLRDSVNLAIDAVPESIDPAAVTTYLQGLPGVSAVHDLHIWGMSTTHVALTAHLVKPGVADDDKFLDGVCHELHHRFGIEHSTLQIERGEGGVPCALASPEVV
ncbi:MAG: cation diffusion facilitator family transporter [Gemmatimonadota bacterium]